MEIEGREKVNRNGREGLVVRRQEKGRQRWRERVMEGERVRGEGRGRGWVISAINLRA